MPQPASVIRSVPANACGASTKNHEDTLMRHHSETLRLIHARRRAKGQQLRQRIAALKRKAADKPDTLDPDNMSLRNSLWPENRR